MPAQGTGATTAVQKGKRIYTAAQNGMYQRTCHSRTLYEEGMSAHVSCDHSRATAHFAGGATHPAISITQQTKTRSTHDRFEHTRGTISITSPNLHGGILGWCLAHRKQKPTHRKHPAFRRVKRGPTCLVDFCIAVPGSHYVRSVRQNFPHSPPASTKLRCSNQSYSYSPLLPWCRTCR